MKQSSIFYASLFVIMAALCGGLLALATGAESLEPSASSTDEKLPAAEIQERGVRISDPPEVVAERAQIEQTARIIQQGRQTPAQLRQMLATHPDPGIRAKATQAVTGKSIAAQPGGGEPAESQVERQETQSTLNRLQQGRLNFAQLRQLLLTHPDPGIRAKALKAQEVQPQRSGEFRSREPATLLGFLWDLVNPFTATNASAQAPVSIKLTPQNPYVLPPVGSNYQGAYINLYNASVTTTFSGITSYQLTPPPMLVKNLAVPTPSTPTAFAPPHQIKVALNFPGPPGWYIIDFFGLGGANAKLYRFHYYSQNYHFVQAWVGGAGPQHYITVEYLSQGLMEVYFFSIGQGPFALAEVLIQQFG